MNEIDLNKFTLKGFLGKGSFGEVRKVEEKETGNIFAAKISFSFLDEESKEDILELTREVNIMSMVHHPSVVMFIGFNLHDFYNDPKPVIITEYMKNGTLEEVINLERLSRSIWDDTKKLINIYGIAAAMAYLHSNHIIHRDLKPSNILIDEYLCPKISDFGLSKIKHQNSESLTMQSTANVKGTPIYISPEIYQNVEYNIESDVYAFAFIMYEIITNEQPFAECKSVEEIKTKVINGIRPKFPYPISDAYQDLIERCWNQDPSKRPTFDEIVDELQNDPSYLTDEIEKDDFFQYVDYIDEYKKTFDKTKKMIRLEDFIQNKTSSFKQVTVDRKKVSQMMRSMNKQSSMEQSSNLGEKIKESMHRSFQKSQTMLIKDSSQKSKSVQSFNKSETSQSLNSKDKSKSRRRSLFRKTKSKSVLIDLPDNECNEIIRDSEGDPQKQFLVGKYFIEGSNNFPQNTENGIKFLEKSIKSECIEAIIYYSNMLIKGDIVPKDLSKAKKILKKQLKKNDASVLYLYGKIEKKERNFQKAAKYFEKATKRGSTEAMHSYAKLCFNGKGCPQSYKNAQYYFDMAKKNGLDKRDSFLAKQTGDSLYFYGMKFYNGYELETNKEEAAKCFRLAVGKNDIASMVQYAYMLKNGIGVDIDKQDAFRLFQIAAQKGDSNAMFYIGDMLYNGDGVQTDEKEALKYLKSAINKGNSLAREKYPKLCEQPNANQKEPASNIKQIKDAADRGDANQSYKLGMMLLKGIDCHPNTKEGIRYIKYAADKNHVDAMFEYASILEKGQGVIQDQNAALHYYKLAADKGHASAKKSYTNILEKRKNEPILIKNFNSFPLKTKQYIISQIAPKYPNNSILEGLHKLASFLMTNELKEKKCFEILINDEFDLLHMIQLNTEYEIQISWEVSEVLFYYNVRFDVLNDIFHYYRSVFVELQYPSRIFEELFKWIFKVKSNVIQVMISIFIYGIRETDSRFMYNELISSVRLGSTVCEIPGDIFGELYAFKGCTSLTRISIPSSVTHIGADAFRNCSMLQYITIPSSVKSFDQSVFFGCSSLKEITLPSSVIDTGGTLFAECSSLTNVTLSNSLMKISDGFFKGCTSLTQVSIPSSVIEIGWNVFLRCTSLRQVSIPSSVTIIGENAFQKCTSLTQISIPPSVTEIGDNAFTGCTSLRRITVPSRLNISNIGIDSNTEVFYI